MKLLPYNTEGSLEIGVDEAGRGPLMGRVYAAAVIWNPELTTPSVLIDDSKKLRPKQLKTAYDYIKSNAIAFGVGHASVEEIDEHNILHATMLAMQRAIRECKLEPDTLLVDGNYFDIMFDKDGNPYKVVTVEKGDGKFLSIAAASILAKWDRDQYIHDLCEQYPELETRYQINSNKGYGSAAHRDGIKKYGITQFHRKSFKSSNGAELNFV